MFDLGQFLKQKAQQAEQAVGGFANTAVKDVTQLPAQLSAAAQPIVKPVTQAIQSAPQVIQNSMPKPIQLPQMPQVPQLKTPSLQNIGSALTQPNIKPIKNAVQNNIVKPVSNFVQNDVVKPFMAKYNAPQNQLTPHYSEGMGPEADKAVTNLLTYPLKVVRPFVAPQVAYAPSTTNVKTLQSNTNKVVNNPNNQNNWNVFTPTKEPTVDIGQGASTVAQMTALGMPVNSLAGWATKALATGVTSIPSGLLAVKQHEINTGQPATAMDYIKTGALSGLYGTGVGGLVGGAQYLTTPTPISITNQNGGTFHLTPENISDLQTHGSTGVPTLDALLDKMNINDLVDAIHGSGIHIPEGGVTISGEGSTPLQRLLGQGEPTTPKISFNNPTSVIEGEQGTPISGYLNSTKGGGDIAKIGADIAQGAQNAAENAKEGIVPTIGASAINSVTPSVGKVDATSSTVPLKSTTPVKFQPATTNQLGKATPSGQEQVPSVLQPKNPVTPATGQVKPSQIQPAETPTPEFLQKSPSGSIISPLARENGYVPTKEKEQKIIDMANYSAENKSEINKGLADWIGSKKNAEITAAQFVKGTTKVPNKLNWDVIRGLQGKTDINPDAAKYIPEQRSNYDKLLVKLNESGLSKTEVKHIQNYALGMWKNNPTDINARIVKAGMGQRVPMMNGKRIPDYDTGMELGLTPAEKNANSLQGQYAKRVETALSNKNFFDNFVKKNNLAVPASIGSKVPGFKSYNVPGFPKSVAVIGEGKQVIGNYYGPSDFVDKVDKILSPKGYGTMDTIPKKLVYGAGKSATGLQHILFSATGIPGTPINAFGLAAVGQKGILQGMPIKTIKALGIGSAGDQATIKWLQGSDGQGGTHLDTVKYLQTHDVPVSTPMDINHVVDRGIIKNIFGNSVSEAWGKLTYEPTFKRVFPIMQVQIAEGEYGLAIKQGDSVEEAQAKAAQAVKTAWSTGSLVKKSSESQLTSSGKRALFFSPEYRPTMVDWWGKVLGSPIKAAKSTFTGTRSPGNTKNLIALGTIALTAYLYNEANKKNTGHNMWENPSGYQNKAIFKLPGGKNVAVPLLPTLATVPTIILNSALDLANGDIAGFGSQMAGLASRPIQIAAQVGSNQDFWGDPIYQGNDSTATKYLKAVGYTLSQMEPASAQVASNLMSGKLPSEIESVLHIKDQPWYQNLTQEAGSTVKYPTDKQLGTAYYYQSRNNAYNKLDSNNQAAFNSIYPQTKDNQGNYIVQPSAWDTIAKSSTILSHPSVLDAIIAMNQEQKSHGLTVDPLWSQSKDQITKVLQYQAMSVDPNGIQHKQWYADNKSWYQPLADSRSKYFDSLPPADPNKPQQPVEYPNPTPQVQSLQNQYYSMTDPTQKFNFLNSHPELQTQFDAQTKYANDLLTARGETPYKDYPKATPQMQSFTDSYLNADKATRKSIRNSDPQSYQNMIAYFDSTDLYNIGHEGAASQLVGNPDSTSKENKAISSVAQDIYQNPDGSYSIVPAGWMQGLSNSDGNFYSGYGSSGASGYKTVMDKANSATNSTYSKLSSLLGGTKKPKTSKVSLKKMPVKSTLSKLIGAKV
jgi:hypothetical protein